MSDRSAVFTLSKLCYNKIVGSFNTEEKTAFRKLKRLEQSLICAQNNLSFVERCARRNVIPDFISRACPSSKTSTSKAIKASRLKLLDGAIKRNRINYNRALAARNQYVLTLDSGVLRLFGACLKEVNQN